MVFAKSTDPNRVLLGGFWVACAAYLTQLMFGLSVTGNSFLLWASIGVVLAPTALSFEVKPKDWGVIAAAFLVALSLAGIFYQSVLMRADYAYLLANVGMQGAQGTEQAKLAVRLNPLNDMYRAEVGMSYRQEMIAAAQAMMQAQESGEDPSAHAALAKEKFDAAVASLKETIAFVPYEYDNYVFLASVYNIGGSLIDPKYYQDAIEWGKKGIEIEPFGPAIRTEYARALLATGKTEEGIKQLKSAWDMDHAHSEAATLLGQEYAKQGRIAEAVALLKLAQAANSSDGNIGELLKQLEGTATPASATPSGKK
jgi:tetratricopeptide (TPR) repeat protein